MSVYHDCILYLLANAYQKAYACFKKRLHEYGLTPVQSLVVMGISEAEGLSAKERDEANKKILGGLRLEEQMLLKRMLKDLR